MLPKDAISLPHLNGSPTDIAALWPAGLPLLALIGNGTDDTWSRWSIIAPADGKRITFDDEHAMEDLGVLLSKKSHTSLLPNWIGYLGYELGYAIEPATGSLPERDWPLVDLIWCDRALIHDALTNSWWSVGGFEPPESCMPFIHPPVEISLNESYGDDSFTNSVQQTVEYIHAGDIFQANMTRRFSSDVEGNLRSTALSMLSNPGGWFGAWIEFSTDGRYLMSMSPELFLQYHGDSRKIVSRPMKGTRPEYDDPSLLIDSSKDAAELHMIVDLMRNDLGRVSEFGSIHVEHSRKIEQHPTVWQCVGEVHGTVREDVDTEQILRATFPAGSVTGAPKIRAMQIIRELEETPRGPYCGAIGIVGNSLMLNVAIRTALFQGSTDPLHFNGKMEYSTGCGIVAESDPESELLESKVKIHILKSECHIR